MRRKHDFYETADWQVRALTDNLPELDRAMVFCPCVGDGSLKDALSLLRPRLDFVTNDIDVTKEADYHLDMTVADNWNAILSDLAPVRIGWVVENFPFSLEHLILPYAVQAARVGVAAMARVSFTEPTKDRGPWLAANPYQKRITMERYSFTNNGKTDSATTDWLVWSRIALQGPFGVVAAGYRPEKTR